MFSLIDALLNQPMEEVLEEVALSEELTSALLGEKSDLRKILDIAVAYEQGDWDQVIALCKEENLSPGRLKQNYNAALEWYNLLQSVG
jgi:metal-dependent hydrolase